jgi:hypothetical protein
VAKVVPPVSTSSGKGSTSMPSSFDSSDSHPELLSDPLFDFPVASSESESEDGGVEGGGEAGLGMGAAAIVAIC